MRYIGWFFRRLYTAMMGPFAGLPCRYRWCGRQTVGYSRWCREHTDRILANEDITGWPRRRTY